MNRKSFIQQCMIQAFPKMMEAQSREEGEQMMNRHIRGAEAMWERLSERGYGETRTKELSPAESWYKRLQGEQKAWFDKFWDKFAYKNGREGAAKAWLQLQVTEPMAEVIITAAGMEAKARESLPKDSRPIMAEGWLRKRRFEDHDVTQVREQKKQASVNMERTRLRNELESLKMLNRDGSLDDQVAKAQARLEELK